MILISLFTLLYKFIRLFLCITIAATHIFWRSLPPSLPPSISTTNYPHTGGPKVYDVTNYLDDHPGGAEVLLDVGGQDSDEFFEDIGHSKDARDELAKHLVGTLKLDEAEIQRRADAAKAAAEKGAGGMNFIVVLIAMLAIFAAYYKTQM